MNLLNKFWYFETGVPLHFCEEIILSAQDKGVVDGVTDDIKREDIVRLSKQKKNTRNSKVCFLNNKWIIDQLEPFFWDANKQAGWDFSISHYETCQFTYYNGQEKHFYDWHLDAGQEPYKEGYCKGTIRKLSMVVLLNKPNDFEGGQLEFDYRNKINPKIDRAPLTKQGSCVVFPSFLWHRVKPVTKGFRYSLVVWATGEKYR